MIFYARRGMIDFPGVPNPVEFLVTGAASYRIEFKSEFDGDGDGLTGDEELALGTDPSNPDTNGDGIPDGMQNDSGQNPLSPDTDGDGLSNVDEVRLGTDPIRTDTDRDGALDAVDAYPLDPTRSTVAPPTAGDITPPVINLTIPSSAIPL